MTSRSDPRLSSFGHARPPAAVVDRMVAGALRCAERPRVRGRPLALRAATAVAAVGVVALCLTTSGRSSLGTGDSLQTEATRAVASAGRHEVTLSPVTEVVAVLVEGGATELRVAKGSARFKVDPLRRGERFQVEAGGIVVEAVGTEFDVTLEGACARVQVAEGKVRVRRSGAAAAHAWEFLEQGGEQPFCPEMPIAPPGPEERLLSEALESVRRGTDEDLLRAEELLRRYRREHPDGVYDQEALYYLARISHRLGRGAAARAFAASFLERYPTGHRAEELRALTAGLEARSSD